MHTFKTIVNLYILNIVLATFFGFTGLHRRQYEKRQDLWTHHSLIFDIIYSSTVHLFSYPFFLLFCFDFCFLFNFRLFNLVLKWCVEHFSDNIAPSLNGQLQQAHNIYNIIRSTIFKIFIIVSHFILANCSILMLIVHSGCKKN